MISTKDTGREQRKENMRAINQSMIEYHQDTFKKLGNDNPHFFVKIPFNIKGTTYLSLYEEELTNKKGHFFTELADDDYLNPRSAERTLYRWIGNKQMMGDYEVNSTGAGKRWYVPLEEFEEISIKKPVEISTLDFSITPETSDSNMNQMTIRDKCAIEWRLPVSNKPWLNELISNTFKNK